MRYRDHRGSFADSMETLVELEPTKAALASRLNVSPERITVECRGRGFYKRPGWNAPSYTVCIDGDAVGFCDEKAS